MDNQYLDIEMDENKNFQPKKIIGFSVKQKVKNIKTSYLYLCLSFWNLKIYQLNNLTFESQFGNKILQTLNTEMVCGGFILAGHQVPIKLLYHFTPQLDSEKKHQ